MERGLLEGAGKEAGEDKGYWIIPGRDDDGLAYDARIEMVGQKVSRETGLWGQGEEN